MTQKIVASGILLVLLAHPALGQCPCPQQKGDLVFSYEFGRGSKLIICGIAHRVKNSANVDSYSSMTVIDCRDGRVLLSVDPPETDLWPYFFRFHVREGQVIIQKIIRLPSEPGWQWAPHPFFEKRVTCTDGRLAISEWQNIFIVPTKTQEEIAAFLDTYENHFDMAGERMEIPDKLMLCALNGSLKAEQLLLSFPKDHSEIYDGALAWTYEEVLNFYLDIIKK